MSEYWVSKKQYWCKYCNIFIRDDAPSRSLHESGLKHQGNKERFIRDIYRGGERAKREKEANAKEFARIEAAASAQHAKDTGIYAGRPAPDRASPVASSSRIRPKASGPGDKLANYSTAAQLGFDDAETQLSSFEIEQMVRGRATSVGKWETVEEKKPTLVYGEQGVPSLPVPAPEVDEEDHENFKFSHRDKRPVRDVYDDDDWDPAALGGIKLKSRERKIGEAEPETGKAGFKKIGEVKTEVKVEVKEEVREEAKEKAKDEANEVKVEDGAEPQTEGSTGTPAAPASGVDVKTEPEPESKPAPATSMFKKRRPPPSSRKK